MSSEEPEYDKWQSYKREYYDSQKVFLKGGFADPSAELPKVNIEWQEEDSQTYEKMNIRNKRDIVVSFAAAQSIRHRNKYRSLLFDSGRRMARVITRKQGILDMLNQDFNIQVDNK